MGLWTKDKILKAIQKKEIVLNRRFYRTGNRTLN